MAKSWMERKLRPWVALIIGALLLAACSGGKRAATPVPGSPAAQATAAATAPGATGVPRGSVAPSAAATPLSAATPLPTAAAGTTPAPPTASRVETVKLVYDILLDRYYKPLTPNALLNNAWRGANDAAGGGVAAPKLSGDRNTDWTAFATQYAQLFAKSGAAQGTQTAFAAAKAMIDGLHDDHTYFLNPQENAQRNADESGGNSYVGIGITISQGAPYTVEMLVAGAPAEKAGVRPGDVITAVDGTATAGLSEQALSDRLRGAEGTAVRLDLRHADGSGGTVSVTRAQIVSPTIQWKVLPDGIGYVQLQSFGDAYARFTDGKNIAQTLDTALQAFEQAGVKGWVFDVRGNPGGSEQTLSEVAGRFLPQGLVLVSTDRDGHATEAPVDGHLFATQRPLAVLIDGNSGSASELFAATMQEYARARLVGEQTAGSVNGALETELPDGAAVQYTVVEARTGKDRRVLDGTGVTPDQRVSGRPGDILAGGTDSQFEAAKQWVLGQAATTPTLALGPAAVAVPLDAAALRAALQKYAATNSDVPDGPARQRFGDLVLTVPNELATGIADDAPNAAELEQALRARGWQGAYQEYFGYGAPPPFTVEIDLYATDAGADTAVRTDDYPYGLRAVQPPAKVGDNTATYTGYDAAAGSDELVFRRGRLVVTVEASVNPGESGLPGALAVAQTLDARIAALPQP